MLNVDAKTIRAVALDEDDELLFEPFCSGIERVCLEFSILWCRVDPFTTRHKMRVALGPASCGVECVFSAVKNCWKQSSDAFVLDNAAFFQIGRFSLKWESINKHTPRRTVILKFEFIDTETFDFLKNMLPIGMSPGAFGSAKRIAVPLPESFMCQRRALSHLSRAPLLRSGVV